MPGLLSFKQDYEALKDLVPWERSQIKNSFLFLLTPFKCFTVLAVLTRDIPHKYMLEFEDTPFYAFSLVLAFMS